MQSEERGKTEKVVHATFEVLDSPVRRQIVDLLAERAAAPDATPDSSGLGAAEVGERLQLHVTTARFHLDRLVASGLVESTFLRGRVGRPRKVYRTPTQALRSAPDDAAVMALSRLLTETWQESEDGVPLTPEQAGRRWALQNTETGSSESLPQARTPGAWLGKVGMTVDLLQQWGYRPDVRTQDHGRSAELVLSDCPVMALAEARPDVVCGVHRGLLKGALEAVGETDTEVGLQPFVEPRLCLARLTTRADFGERVHPPT